MPPSISQPPFIFVFVFPNSIEIKCLCEDERNIFAINHSNQETNKNILLRRKLTITHNHPNVWFIWTFRESITTQNIMSHNTNNNNSLNISGSMADCINAITQTDCSWQESGLFVDIR